MSIVAAFLLVVGVGTIVGCALGVLVMPTVFDRLAYLGPATSLAPFAIALAVLVNEGLSAATVKSFLTAAVLTVTGPIVTHITARAARVRQHGHWGPMPQEKRVRL